MNRRDFVNQVLAAAAAAQAGLKGQQQTPANVFLERDATGTPHRGKVLLALQAHSDDIPLNSAGTVAKLIQEGYTGYLVRATNDDMGDAPGLGTRGTIGDMVKGNETDNTALAKILGCKANFDLNYNNHMMGGIAFNELLCRLIFLIRVLKADTVVCWDPWAHDEENPDHYTLAKGVEAASWIAGREHDYPEQFAAPGVQPHAVTDKYYYARRPEITRVVDITKYIDKKIESNRANVYKGPAGTNGSRLRAELAKKGQKLPLLGEDDASADRNYIRQFVMGRSRSLGERYGVQYAEAFHYIGPGANRENQVEEYIRKNAIPLR